jgi:WD40 repeat protein
MAFLPDGQLLASGSWDGKVRLWDTTSWLCVRVLEGETSFGNSVTFSPNSQQLASGGGSDGPGTVRLWNAVSGECL